MSQSTRIALFRVSLMFGAGAAALVVAGTSDVSAHRLIGRAYPTLATAFIQPPPAPNNDLPIPLWNTGLSVVCLRVTNTSPVDARITALGIDLPGARRRGFALLSPLERGVTLHENVGPVPGFAGVELDFALSTGATYESGIPPGPEPTVVCLSGPFDPALPIETMLNGAFVQFQGGEATGNASDIGVWERR
jgi:hypothetical protein